MIFVSNQHFASKLTDRALSEALNFLRSKSSKDFKPENSSQLTSELHELGNGMTTVTSSQGKKISGLAALMKPLRHALTGRKVNSII